MYLKMQVHIRIALKVSHEIKCYEGGHFTLEGGILPWRGTFYPSVDCPGGHCTLVQNVREDKF